MSTYHLQARHLQARLLTGPLHEPTRDELRTAESDSWEELSAVADQLVADGFTVWLFAHGPCTPIPNASDYRLITHLRPQAVRSPRGCPIQLPALHHNAVSVVGDALIPGGSSEAPPAAGPAGSHVARTGSSRLMTAPALPPDAAPAAIHHPKRD